MKARFLTAFVILFLLAIPVIALGDGMAVVFDNSASMGNVKDKEHLNAMESDIKALLLDGDYTPDTSKWDVVDVGDKDFHALCDDIKSRSYKGDLLVLGFYSVDIKNYKPDTYIYDRAKLEAFFKSGYPSRASLVGSTGPNSGTHWEMTRAYVIDQLFNVKGASEPVFLFILSDYANDFSGTPPPASQELYIKIPPKFNIDEVFRMHYRDWTGSQEIFLRVYKVMKRGTTTTPKGCKLTLGSPKDKCEHPLGENLTFRWGTTGDCKKTFTFELYKVGGATIVKKETTGTSITVKDKDARFEKDAKYEWKVSVIDSTGKEIEDSRTFTVKEKDEIITTPPTKTDGPLKIILKSPDKDSKLKKEVMETLYLTWETTRIPDEDFKITIKAKDKGGKYKEVKILTVNKNTKKVRFPKDVYDKYGRGPYKWQVEAEGKRSPIWQFQGKANILPVFLVLLLLGGLAGGGYYFVSSGGVEGLKKKFGAGKGDMEDDDYGDAF